MASPEEESRVLLGVNIREPGEEDWVLLGNTVAEPEKEGETGRPLVEEIPDANESDDATAVELEAEDGISKEAGGRNKTESFPQIGSTNREFR